jgi:invasion protein IalB
MAIFSVQLPSQMQAKTDKRGQQPFLVDNKNEIRETMLSLAPTPVDIPKGAAYQTLERAVNQLSQFGVLPGCVVNGALERQGLSTLRYQTRGTREVAWLLA